MTLSERQKCIAVLNARGVAFLRRSLTLMANWLFSVKIFMKAVVTAAGAMILNSNAYFALKARLEFNLSSTATILVAALLLNQQLIGSLCAARWPSYWVWRHGSKYCFNWRQRAKHWTEVAYVVKCSFSLWRASRLNWLTAPPTALNN